MDFILTRVTICIFKEVDIFQLNWKNIILIAFLHVSPQSHVHFHLFFHSHQPNCHRPVVIKGLYLHLTTFWHLDVIFLTPLSDDGVCVFGHKRVAYGINRLASDVFSLLKSLHFRRTQFPANFHILLGYMQVHLDTSGQKHNKACLLVVIGLSFIDVNNLWMRRFFCWNSHLC